MTDRIAANARRTKNSVIICVRGLLAAAGLDRTARPPHRCGSVVVPHTRQFLLAKMQSAESSGDNLPA